MTNRRALVIVDASAIVDPWEPDGGNLDDLAGFAYAAGSWGVETMSYCPPEVSPYARWAFTRLEYLGCKITDEPIPGRARQVWWVHGWTERSVPVGRADRMREVAVDLGVPVPWESILDEVKQYAATMAMRSDG